MSALDGWIDVCRAGTWTDSAKRTVDITEASMDAMVSQYSQQDPAPVVVGHPGVDAPAYAWVSDLRRVGDRLQAKFRDIAPAFRAAVEAGSYSNRSIAATADHRLVHIGFLGGRAPAVPGLAPTQFSSTPSHTITFAESDLTTRQGARFIARAMARLMRGLREDKIAADGVEAADQVYAAWDIDHLNRIADDMEDGADLAGPALNKTPTKKETPDMSDTSTPAAGANPAARATPPADQAALAARAAELDAREARIAASEARFAEAARLAAARDRLAPHVQAGRILPAEEPALAALLAAQPEGDQGDHMITFAGPDGAGEVREQPAAILDRFFAALPARVPYAELAGGAPPPQPGETTASHDVVAAEARILMSEAAARGEIITSVEAVDRVRAKQGLGGQAHGAR